MAVTTQLARIDTRVRGTSVAPWSGGSGETILLLHGGWANAEFHFARVWGLLAMGHRVLAPDLPGLGEVRVDALPRVRDYAAWLTDLLDSLDIEAAWLVGNSFGAAVAWSLAGRFPDRARGLVLVDGFPMPATPRLLFLAGRTRVGRALMRAALRRNAYHPRRIADAFADIDQVPDGFERLVAEDWPLIVPRFADLLIAGDGAPTPSLAPLLIFGEEDRLPGTHPEDARKLQKTLSGSTLRMIPRAGHFPQIEQPEAFADVVTRFVETN